VISTFRERTKTMERPTSC